MWPSSVVVPHPFAKDLPKMSLMQRNHEVKALAAHCSHQSLAECIGLRRTRRRLHDPDSEMFDRLIQFGGKTWRGDREPKSDKYGGWASPPGTAAWSSPQWDEP